MNKKLATNILISIALFFFMASVSSAQILDVKTSTLIKENAGQIQKASGLGATTIGSIIATIIQVGLGFLAAIFLVLMIVAGFQWMTASGNEEQTKKALSQIKNAVIGLVIVLAAYSITYFVFTYLPFSGSGLPTN